MNGQEYHYAAIRRVYKTNTVPSTNLRDGVHRPREVRLLASETPALPAISSYRSLTCPTLQGGEETLCFAIA